MMRNDDDYEVTERSTDYNWFRNLDGDPFYSDWEEFIPNSNKEESLDSMDELPGSLREAIFFHNNCCSSQFKRRSIRTQNNAYSCYQTGKITKPVNRPCERFYRRNSRFFHRCTVR